MELSHKKELKTNTILFGVGEICTKALQYVVALFLSFFLSTQESGDITLIKTSASLMIPIVSFAIIESVFIFSADKKHDNKSVFSVGILFSISGSIVLIPLSFLVNRVFNVSTPIIIYLFVALLMIHNIVHYFVKGIGKVKLYVINSIVFALGTCAVTILCLFLFRGGIKTFFFCYIATYCVCIVFMFLSGKLWRYISIKSINKNIVLDMIKYSSPLIVNTIGWWLISASDTYITNHFLGKSFVGILSYSHKFPTILNSIYSIFGMAFQLLAISNFNFDNLKEKEQAEASFSNVLDKLTIVLGLFVLLIILCTEPAIKLLVSKEYYESWRYVALYTLGMFFFSLASFYGYIYNIKKKNIPLLISTLICGVCNIGLCILFYFIFGSLIAAALSTAISYFVVFVFRMIDSRKILKVAFNKKMIIAILFLLVPVFLNSVLSLPSRPLFAINFLFTMSYVIVFKNDILYIGKVVLHK